MKTLHVLPFLFVIGCSGHSASTSALTSSAERGGADADAAEPAEPADDGGDGHTGGGNLEGGARTDDGGAIEVEDAEARDGEARHDDAETEHGGDGDGGHH